MTTEVLEYETLRVEIDGGLATFTLNDPDRLNAVSDHMAHALVEALREIAKPRRGIRCLMLTGEGRSFCAGVNMLERRQNAEQAANLPALSGLESTINPLIRILRDVQHPIVAAVNGPCVGIGVALALLSDYVIASEEAYFLLPFRNLASCCDSGLTWLLPRAIGLQRARKMMLGAQRVTAATALDWGLVSEVAPAEGFRALAHSVANDYAAAPTVALSTMRQLLLDSDGVSLDAHLEAEARGVRITARTRDNQAAIRAFGTKIRPEFIGS